jgi:hypothetical protein
MWADPGAIPGVEGADTGWQAIGGIRRVLVLFPARIVSSIAREERSGSGGDI